MTPDQEKYEAQLALLLDLQPRGDGVPEARTRLLNDPRFRREFGSLQEVAEALERLGAALHDAAGSVDLQQDMRDAIAHHALEELAVADVSPYKDLEQAFAVLRADFDSTAGEVSLVADIMAAVAASKMTDDEVELPFPREAGRLRALGREIDAHVPEVALVEPVMSEAVGRTSSNVVPMRARPVTARTVKVSPVERRFSRAVALAAAVALCVGGYWLYSALYGGGADIDKHAQEGGLERQPEVRELPPGPLQTAEIRPVAPIPPAEPPEQSEVEGNQEQAPPLTLQDVLNARRRDLVNGTKAVAALASLSEEEAIELIKSLNLSVEALIGATDFLSTEDAIAALRAAIAEHPDDPNLRYALAKKLEANPDLADERLEQLTQLAQNDPENGLPQYMMASDYFARGDTALALDALTRGSGYSEASAYGLEAARQREASLVASGVPADVARFLALSTAGETEYGDISSLRNELLDYGAYYEGIGDFDTASQIYQAINQLGKEVTEGAELATERQAGLETQQEAVIAIQGIAEAFQKPEIAAMLGDELTLLASSIAEIAQYIQARQELVLNPSVSSRLDWNALLSHMINEGDLNIGDVVQ